MVNVAVSELPTGTATLDDTFVGNQGGTTKELTLPKPFEFGGILTISGGAVTLTQNYGSFFIDTEASAATDDLNTINDSNAYDGKIIILAQTSSSRDITIKHNAGNIFMTGGDYTATAASTGRLMLQHYNGNWFEISRVG